MKKVLSAVLLAVALPQALAAQDNSELARALARRGWFDLAEELCVKIEKDSSTPAELRSAVPFIRAEIQVGMADRERDVEKAKGFIEESVKLLNKFMKDQPGHRLALDARINIGWLMTRKAKAFTDAMEEETDASKISAFQKQAQAIFNEAITFYKGTIDELQKASAKATDKTQVEVIEDAILNARLELPKAMLGSAKMGGIDEEARRKVLLEALGLLKDFEMDYGAQPVGFEGTMVGAQVLVLLGDTKSYQEAEMKFRGAISLRKALRDNNMVENDFHRRIIYCSYIDLCQLYRNTGRANECKNTVDQVLRENKGAEKQWFGYLLRMEKAEAMASLKDIGGAQTILREIIASDNGPFKAKAQVLMGKLGGSGGSREKASPEQIMAQADGAIDRGDFPGAIPSLRRCVDSCTTEAEKTKYVPSALFKMGKALQGMKRNYEAFFAYQGVFTGFKKSTNAAEACFRAILCLNAEFATGGDKRDNAQIEALLQMMPDNWPGDPMTLNGSFFKADRLEKNKEWKAAGELYLTMDPKAGAYEEALIRGGYCLYRDGEVRFAKTKDPKVVAEIKAQFLQSEAALNKFLARCADPATAPTDPDQIKARVNFRFVANQQLANIYIHEVIGQADKALGFLDKVAGEMQPEDEKLAGTWEMQIKAHLALKQVDKAVAILDQMFEKFPDGAPIARSSKSVAIRLHGETDEMVKNKAPQAAIEANLRKISKYYAKWLRDGPSRGLRITMDDVLSVADAVYMIAKQLNGLDDKTTSFLDLKGKVITERAYFENAAYVHTLLLDGKIGKLSDKDRIQLMTRQARCHSFTASSQEDWDKAKDAYSEIITHYKLITPQGIDMKVLQPHMELLTVYIELGNVYFELGQRGNKFQFDNASGVFGNIQGVAARGSEPYWLAKYMQYLTLYSRGAPKDITLAQLGLKNLEENEPGYAGAAKFGLQDKLKTLKAQVDKAVGGK